MSEELSEIVVLETTDPTEILLARNLMEEDGIPCRVQGGSASSLLDAVLGPQVAGLHELLVPADLEERALNVLEAAWKGRPREEQG